MTRKQLCMNRMLAKKADIHRIYLPCLHGRWKIPHESGNRVKGYNRRTFQVHDKQE